METITLQEPLTEGRNCIKHASTFFPFIEAISEVHPIAKGLVVCKKKLSSTVIDIRGIT